MSNQLLIFLAIFGVCAVPVLAQNLVPNPNFENYSTCPTTLSELDKAYPWISPTNATPDYFNRCNAPCIDYILTPICVPINFTGEQEPHSGDGYAGFYTYEDDEYREYIQAPLNSPLEAGICYEVSFYVSSSDPGLIGVKGLIGAYFSGQAISSNQWTVLDTYTPQIIADSVIDDSDNWVLVSEIFEAMGGEQYITIGHFSNNTTTVYPNPPSLEWYSSYFLIDDVSVIALAECQENEDTLTGTTPEVVPTLATLLMPNVFTPNMDGINDLFAPSEMIGVSYTDLLITNRWGEVVYQGDVLKGGWDGKWKGNACSEGTYFWKIRFSASDGPEQTQQGFVVLSR